MSFGKISCDKQSFDISSKQLRLVRGLALINRPTNFHRNRYVGHIRRFQCFPTPDKFYEYLYVKASSKQLKPHTQSACPTKGRVTKASKDTPLGEVD